MHAMCSHHFSDREDVALVWLPPSQFLYLEYPALFVLHRYFKWTMHPVLWQFSLYLWYTLISFLVYLFTHLPDRRVWPIFVVLRSSSRLCPWGGVRGGGRWTATFSGMASWRCHVDIRFSFELRTFWGDYRLILDLYFWLYWPLLAIIFRNVNLTWSFV